MSDGFQPGPGDIPIQDPSGVTFYQETPQLDTSNVLQGGVQDTVLQGDVQSNMLQGSVQNDFTPNDTGPTQSCPLLLPEIPKLALPPPPKPPRKPLVGGVSKNVPGPQIILQAETPKYDTSGGPGTPGNPLQGGVKAVKLVTGISTTVRRPRPGGNKKKINTPKRRKIPGPTGGKPSTPLKTGIKNETPEPEGNFKLKYPQVKWGTEIPTGGKRGDAEKNRTTRLIGFEDAWKKVGDDNLNVQAGATAGDISVVNNKEHQSVEVNLSAAAAKIQAEQRHFGGLGKTEESVTFWEGSAKFSAHRDGNQLKTELGAEITAAKISGGASINIPIPFMPGKVLQLGGDAEGKLGIGGKIEGAIGPKKIKFGIKGALGFGGGFGGSIGIDDAPKKEGKGEK